MSQKSHYSTGTQNDIRQRIFLYIESTRSNSNNILKIPDVVFHCEVSKHVAREYVKEYAESVLNNLMTQIIESQSDFSTWCDTFRYFRDQLERKHNYQALRIKHIDYAIRFLVLKGEFTALALGKIVGGMRAQWRERVRNFEKESGLQLNPRQSWKKKLHNWDPTDKSDTKDTLYHYLDECRKNRTVARMADLARHTKRSQPTISKNIQPYLDKIANELNNKIVVTQEEIKSWYAEFNIFKNFFFNLTRYGFLREKRIILGIESVKMSYGYVSYTDVVTFTGSSTPLVNAAIRNWESQSGESAITLKSWRKVTLVMVLEVIPAELRLIPMTFMDLHAGKSAMAERHLRTIYHIPQPELRSVAFFVLSFADTNRANDITFFSTLSKIFLLERIPDIGCISADKFFNDYFTGIISPGDSKSKRATTIQSYFRLLKRQEEYFRLLNLEQRAIFSKYWLPEINDTFFWTHADPYSSSKEEAKSKRKKKTDVVHNKFYILRNIAERRGVQINRLLEAYNSLIDQHRLGEIQLPYHFSISDESITDNGSIFEVEHKLCLWDCTTLTQIHSQIKPDFYKYATPSQQKIFDLQGLYFLHYEGGSTKSGMSLDYWFMRDEEMNGNTISRPKLLKGVPGGYDWDLPTRSWHLHLRTDLSTRFIPLEILKRGSLIGNAAIQIMTKTGARMNEFLQVRLTPERLCRVRLGENKDTIAFWAMPKGRKEEEPYYIDEKCMQALHSWWSYNRAKGIAFDVVNPVRALDIKLEPANYLWQVNNKHLSHKEVNDCIRFLWADVQFITAEGNSFDVTSHLLRHGFATELRALDTPLDVVGMLMKQRDIKVTDYYSKPPPAILAEMQRRIFESRIDLSKSHMRTADEMRRQISDAKEKIGALIPIVGGTCTVANACPVKYACIGCAGNVPDPAKRVQVIELKSAYQAVAAFARKSGLPAEIRKAEQVVSSCDELMLEMDLIEATEQSASSPINIRPRKK